MIKDFISVNVEGIQEAIKEAVAEALGNNVQIAKTEEKHSEYYDRQELCRLAHISTCTLWRMESEGLIHKMKFGRRNLYDKEEIDARSEEHTSELQSR